MKGLEKHDNVQEWDNSHAFVAGYVEQRVKDAIIDQLGRM
nr:MAG TPA: Get5 carboxyl domain [Caudoviricetes sp.]